jgi:iron complex outermembrane receptor protein
MGEREKMLRKLRFVLLSGVVIGGFGAAHAFAQAAAAADESDSNNLSEIVVTAQRRSERLNDVPLTVFTNSREQLQAAGVVDISGLGTVTPGLTFSSQGAFAIPSIRGVSTSFNGASADNPVALYVDGAYQPSKQSAFADLPDVDHVEVLKGPQGTLFGRNSTAGAILIFTKEPSFEPHMDLSATESGYLPGNGAINANSTILSGFVTGPLIADKVAASLSASWRDSGGYYINDAYGRDPYVTHKSAGGIEGRVVRGKLLWKATDDFQISFEVHDQQRNDGSNISQAQTSFLDGYQGVGWTGLPGAIVAHQPYHVSFDQGTPHDDWEEYGGQVKLVWNTGIGRFSNQTSYTKTTSNILVNVAAAANQPAACYASFSCVDYTIIDDAQALENETLFSSEKFNVFGASANIIAGVFYYHNNSNFENFLNNTPYPQTSAGPGGFFFDQDQIPDTAVSGFSEANLDFDKWHFIAGGRYNVETLKHYAFYGGFGLNPVTGLNDLPSLQRADPFQVTYRKVTPRVSVRYSWTPDLNTYFTRSVGFKSGLLPVQGTQTQPLPPENLTSYELGLKLSKQNYHLDVALWYYDYKDLQVQQFTGFGGINQSADARLYGLDLDFQYRFNEHWEARLGGSWVPEANYIHYNPAQSYNATPAYTVPYPGSGLPNNSAIDADGTRLPRAPKLTSFVDLSYRTGLSLGRFEAHANGYYSTDAFWTPDLSIKSAAYFLLGANVSLEPNNLANLRFTLFGKNLLNDTYYVGAVTSPAAGWGFYNPPREVGLRADYSF